MKRKFWIILVLLLISKSVDAQLPPVFSKKENDMASFSEMSKAYLIPNRIVWKSDTAKAYIQNESKLLEKGNGQVAVNDTGHFRMVSDSTNKPGILLDFGKELYGGIKISMGIRESKKPLKLPTIGISSISFLGTLIPRDIPHPPLTGRSLLTCVLIKGHLENQKLIQPQHRDFLGRFGFDKRLTKSNFPLLFYLISKF